MASEVDIANSALQALGDDPIVSLDDSNKRARAMKGAYPRWRRQLLRSHPWNFATTRKVLAADAQAPEFGFLYRYSLPQACLRVLEIRSGLHQLGMGDYTIEGRYILSDYEAPLHLVFTADVTDPNLFDTLFIECLALQLAIATCNELAKSASLQEGLKASLTDLMSHARLVDGMENPPQEQDVDDWLLARL